MKILPGIGVGCIRYGMKESKVIQILGDADKVEEFEYIKGENDWYRELCYLKQGLTLSFSSEDNFKLGEISITGKEHLLFSKDILGYTIDQAKKFISGITTELAIYEDCTWGKEETSELLHLEGLGLMLWFKSGVLDELVCSYLFENDNETVIWPK